MEFVLAGGWYAHQFADRDSIAILLAYGVVRSAVNVSVRGPQFAGDLEPVEGDASARRKRIAVRRRRPAFNPMAVSDNQVQGRAVADVLKMPEFVFVATGEDKHWLDGGLARFVKKND